MKEQTLVSIALKELARATGDGYLPMELPLVEYFSEGWRIVSYQLVGEGARGYCYAVVLFEREAK